MPFLGPLIVAIGAKIAAAKVAIIVSVALSAGTALVSRLLRPRRRIEALDGAKSTIQSEIVPARWILGEGVLAPGALVYFGSAGRDARMALVLSEGECGRIRNRVKIDGQSVPLVRTADADGDLLKPQAASKFADKIEFREYFKGDGTQGTHMRTAAPTETYTYDQGDGTYGSFPNYGTEFQRRQGQDEPYVTPFPEWTAAHQLQGLSWVYVRLTQPEYGTDIDKRFWTRVPNLEFLVDGLKITWPGEATPTTTSNAAAVRYWWETERRGRVASAIDAASFTAAYALSDEDVDATNGGADPLPAGYDAWPTTSKRYSIRGVFASGDDIGGVEDRLDVAWAGEVVESAGSLYFRPGVDRPSLLSIGDAQIIEPPVARPWPALQERVNALTGEIPQSAQHDWSSLSLPQVPESVTPAALERAGGKRSGHVRLAYISDPLTAGRLLAVNLRRGQESLRIQVVVTPGETFERTGLIPTDRVLLTNSEYGLVQSRFEVERVLIRQDGAVALTLREDLVGTYDDTLVLPPLEPRVIRLEDDRQVPDVAGLTSDEIAETGSDGVTAIHLLISWDASDARETEINIREKVAAGAWESIISVGSNLRLPGVVAGAIYQVRARHWNRRGVAGEWTAIHENTVDGDLTPPGQMTSLDLNPLAGGYRAEWTNPTDDDFAAARVYASGSNSFATAALVAEVSADYYVATGLPTGTAVFVWVRALDSSGNAGQVRGPVEVTPLAPGVAAAILTGAGQPDNADGKNGDIYVQAGGTVWRKIAGIWVDTGIDLTGPSGATIRSGAIADGATPTGSGTTVGDVFLATDGRWWRWSGTAWIFQGNLTGRDGPGAEFVFQTTTTSVAPTLIQLPSNVMQMDDQVPDNWEDDPQGVDATNQFEWVSQRARNSAGVWGNFSAPALWAVYIPGSMVHDIGSATEPAADLGVIGDTAINDGGEYWLKGIAGWVRRGDLTGPGSEVYFYGSGEALTVFPPPASFGVDGDIAIGPDGRVLRKVSGAWVDVELVIPAPTGLSAVYTVVTLSPTDISSTIYDLRVQWVGGNYLTEIDLGFIFSIDIDDLAGATWGMLDGISAAYFHDFNLIRRVIQPGAAVRARHIGSFGQRGPWSYALYSTDTVLAIDSFAADNTSIESGDTVTLTWTIRNADSASINQGVGALSSSQLESGSTQVNPTATTTYRLTAIGGGNTVTKDVRVTVVGALAQPSITSFAPDDSTLSTTQTTTVRWTWGQRRSAERSPGRA